jgi:hypothetical protein
MKGRRKTEKLIRIKEEEISRRGEKLHEINEER